MAIEDFDIEPTFEDPKTDMGKNFEKKFTQNMRKDNVSNKFLEEADSLLNEKEQSLKKKIFQLDKMEALVHGDQQLSAVYNKMAEDGDEKYGYHYNETIMNLIFNEYILNSPKYLQKYKMTVPKEKKRRDKSGINQLQRAGQIDQKREELRKKQTAQKKQYKSEGEIHNNSLPGTLEEKTTSGNFGIASGVGGFDVHRDGTNRTEQSYDTMKEPIREEQEQYLEITTPIGSEDDKLFTDVINQGIDSHLEGFTQSKFDVKDTSLGKRRVLNFHTSEVPLLVRRLEEIGTDEAMMWAENINNETNLDEDMVQEHHHETREDQINFITRKNKSLRVNDLKDLSDDEINQIYLSLENEMDVDETTGAASAGAFTPALQMESKEQEERVSALYHQALEKLGLTDYDYESDMSDEQRQSITDYIKTNLESRPTPTIGSIGESEEKEEPIDETTTSASSGQYSGPFGKNRHKKLDTPAWEGGEIIGESEYLTDPSGFKKFINEMEEAEKMKGEDPCWDGYEMVGKKKKGGKEVPNCVPKQDESALRKPDLKKPGLKEFEMSDTSVPTMTENTPFSFEKLKNIDTQMLGNVFVDLMNVMEKYGEVAQETGLKDNISMVKNAIDLRPDKENLTPEAQQALKKSAPWWKRMFGMREGDEETLQALDQDLQADGVNLNLTEEAPPGMEDWIKDRKEDFKKQYGDKWEEVLYATAWKRHNKEKNEGEVNEINPIVGSMAVGAGGAIADRAMDKVFGKNESVEPNKHPEAASAEMAKKIEDVLEPSGLSFDQLSDDEQQMVFDELGIGSEEEIAGVAEPQMEESIIDQPPVEDRDSTTMKLKSDGMGMSSAPTISPVGGIGESVNESEEVLEDVSTRTKCKSDEVPVKGIPINKKGGCKKKFSDKEKQEAETSPHNIESRRKRMAKYEKELEAKKGEYSQELEKNKKQMDKLKGKEVNEDKRPSALVMKDRLGVENEKNFKADMEDSPIKDVMDAQDELKAMDQMENVPDNPYELAEKIEKQHLETNDGKAFKNMGDSTNDKGDEIPKRNMTSPEEREKDMITKRQSDWVFDNEPSERFEERMKKDMGEEIYKQRQDKMEYNAEAPMYNKDPQHTQETEVEKDQFDKNASTWNERDGVKKNKLKKIDDLMESMMTGKYRDEFGKTKLINFKLNETIEAEQPCESCVKINLDGMGNAYTTRVDENFDMRQLMDSFEFYMNGGQVTRVKTSGRQIMSEGETKEKPMVNEQLEKMRKLMGYDPSKHVNTDNVKKNRNF